MRTIDRLSSRGFFRGREFSRGMTMLFMLGVLVLLISRVSEPRTWYWLTGESATSTHQEKSKIPPEGGTTTEPDTKGPVRVSVTPPLTEAADVTPGPTDEDEEQQTAAQEEFQAVTDSTPALQREEMTVYWRLFSWAEHQSLHQMSKRARRQVVLNEFMQSPDEERGKLVELQLNVRRILSYDAPVNSAGIQKVHEVWGFTDESKAWLYVGVTAHLPPGMPTGANVQEKATFVGYFLKLQGYEAAGAKPNDRPLAAPLLVGRMAWKPDVRPASSTGSNPDWTICVLAGLGGVLVIRLVLPLVWRGSPKHAPALSRRRSVESGEVSVEDWLSRAEQGKLPDHSENGK